MSPFSRLRRTDRAEHEADTMAARALTPIVAPAPRRLDAQRSIDDIPGLPAGEPLAPAVRAEAQRRFQHDFSQVRVHVGDVLGDTAHAIGSRAFAIGTHVAFAPGAYRPRSVDGQRLLAHELAHVVQASEGLPLRVRSQKAPSVTLFYQKELDRTNGSWGHELLALRPFIALCDAVDKERADEIPSRLDALEAANIAHYPPSYPAPSTASALLSRLTLLGQLAPARRFRTWYSRVVRFGKNPAGGRQHFDDEIWVWEGTLTELRQRADASAGEKNLLLVDAMQSFFMQVLGERARLDPTQVKEDAERLKGQGGLTDSRFGMESGPIVSIARFHARLGRLALDTFTAAQQPLQFALDAAVGDLTAGKGGARLADVEKRLTGGLGAMADAMAAETIEINETVYVKEGSKDVLRQVDRFLEGPAALRRSVKLTSYDETTDTTFPRPSQLLPPPRIVVIRLNQIAALKRIYGLDVDAASKQPTADARENQAALKALGKDGLRLHNDDDWRRFAKAKFEQRLTATGKADEALDAVIDLLKVYLKAFTVHSPMNIDDFGDNLLSLTFPRALTGQLVHDCGVYALRIAFVLSLIRDHPRLKLRIRYVQLPVHVGLILTGDGLPAYFIHNDTFTRYDAAELQAWRARWNTLDENGEPRTTPAASSAKNDEQFLGELAAMEFVPNTDMPFIVTDVPALAGRSGADDRNALWRSYQGIVRNELFGPPTHDPKDPAYQFHLKYLDALDAMKAHHNTFVVPFWNGIAHPAWVAARAALTRTHTAIGAAKDPATRTKAEAAYDVEMRRYLLDKRRDAPSVNAAFAQVLAAFSPITNKTTAITHQLQTQPKIVAPRAGRASGDRLLAMFQDLAHPFWARETLEHFQLVRTRTIDPPPPFADKKKLLDFVD